MCITVAYDSVVQEAQEDIPVYKYLQKKSFHDLFNFHVSPYRNKLYRLNKTITATRHFNRSVKELENRGLGWETEDYKSTRTLIYGLHSFSDLVSALRYGMFDNRSTFLFKAIIPKGSRYLKSGGGVKYKGNFCNELDYEVLSDRLIVTDECLDRFKLMEKYGLMEIIK